MLLKTELTKIKLLQVLIAVKITLCYKRHSQINILGFDQNVLNGLAISKNRFRLKRMKFVVPKKDKKNISAIDFSRKILISRR